MLLYTGVQVVNALFLTHVPIYSPLGIERGKSACPQRAHEASSTVSGSNLQEIWCSVGEDNGCKLFHVELAIPFELCKWKHDWTRQLTHGFHHFSPDYCDVRGIYPGNMHGNPFRAMLTWACLRDWLCKTLSQVRTRLSFIIDILRTIQWDLRLDRAQRKCTARTHTTDVHRTCWSRDPK